MGCWNGTCGVSRLPIRAGDAIVLYPLLLETRRPPEMGGGVCYPYEMAQPLTIGVRGVYNDYGGIETLEGTSLPWVQKYFADNAELFVDVDGAEPDMDFEDLEAVLNDGIERGVLFTSDMHFGTGETYLRPLGLMMMHADVHDRVVQSVGDAASWRFPDKQVRQLYGEKLELGTGAPRAKGTDAQMFKSLQRLRMVQELSELTSLVAKSDRFLRHFIDLPQATRVAKSKREAARYGVVDLLLLNAALTSLRTPWNIQCGAGSQADIDDTHIALATCVQEHLDRHAQEQAENDDE